MLQKKLHKRRIRNVIPKILFLCCLFLLTSGVLFTWYFYRQKDKKLFLSPIATIVQKNSIIQNSNQTSAIEDVLKKNNLTPVSITEASDSAVLVTLDTNEQIIFSEKKDLNQQITSLQLIRRQLTIEGKRLQRVDFRFDNPVVSF